MRDPKTIKDDKYQAIKGRAKGNRNEIMKPQEH